MSRTKPPDSARVGPTFGQTLQPELRPTGIGPSSPGLGGRRFGFRRYVPPNARAEAASRQSQMRRCPRDGGTARGGPQCRQGSGIVPGRLRGGRRGHARLLATRSTRERPDPSPKPAPGTLGEEEATRRQRTWAPGETRLAPAGPRSRKRRRRRRRIDGPPRELSDELIAPCPLPSEMAPSWPIRQSCHRQPLPSSRFGTRRAPVITGRNQSVGRSPSVAWFAQPSFEKVGMKR